MAGKKTNRKALTLEDKQKVYKKIGKRLKELRDEKGYTAALSFAYENEIPPAQYARYEAGSNMKIDSLLKVLNAMDISLAEFFKDFK